MVTRPEPNTYIGPKVGNFLGFQQRTFDLLDDAASFS